MALAGHARAALLWLLAISLPVACRPPVPDPGADAYVSPGDAGGDSLSDAVAADAARDAAPRQCFGYPKVTTGVQSRSTTVNGRTRTYLLSIPSSYDASFPIPMVFAWHDVNGSGAQARSTFDLESQAPGTAMFVYPDALPQPSMQNQPAWDLTATGADLKLFDTLYSTLTSQLCVDHLRVFSVGHGRGGTLSSQLACLRGGTLRAVASVAGLSPTVSCGAGKAIWLVAGESDPTIDFDTQAVAVRDTWLNINGCGASWLNINPWPCKYHLGCRVDQPVHWCPHDGNHDWPKFAPSGVWGFFMSFSEPAVR